MFYYTPGTSDTALPPPPSINTLYIAFPPPPSIDAAWRALSGCSDRPLYSRCTARTPHLPPPSNFVRSLASPQRAYQPSRTAVQFQVIVSQISLSALKLSLCNPVDSSKHTLKIVVENELIPSSKLYNWLISRCYEIADIHCFQACFNPSACVLGPVSFETVI